MGGWREGSEPQNSFTCRRNQDRIVEERDSRESSPDGFLRPSGRGANAWTARQLLHRQVDGRLCGLLVFIQRTPPFVR